MLRALSRLAFAKSLRVFNAFAACATVLGSLLAALPAAAQTPERIANIEQATHVALCDIFEVNGRILYTAYAASNTSSDCRLFSTDQHLSSPIPLGPSQHTVHARKVNGRLVFLSCSVSLSQCEVWSTDGTPSGTAPLAPGTTASQYDPFDGGTAGTPLLVRAINPQGESRWLATDGTAAGTRDVGPRFYSGPTAATSDAYFWAENNGIEWRIRRRLLATGEEASVATYPVEEYVFFELKNTSPTHAFFVAQRYAGVTRTDLISATAGIDTAQILLTRPEIGYTVPIDTAGKSVVFGWCTGSLCQLYRSDGTVPGTAPIPDSIDGLVIRAPSATVVVTRRNNGSTLFRFVDENGQYPLLAGASATWLGPNRNALTLCVPAGEVVSAGAWVGDGTPTGMQRLSDQCDTPNVAQAIAIGNAFYLQSADVRVQALEKISYPDKSRTTLKGSPTASTRFGAAFKHPDGYGLFTACDNERMCGLWRTDGTSSGTQLLRSFQISDPQYGPAFFGAVGSKTFFFTNSTQTDPSIAGSVPVSTVLLGVTDGTVTGTQIVKTWTGVSFYFSRLGEVSAFRELGQRTYFAACFENVPDRCGLWSTDGTEAGTNIVASIASQNLPEIVQMEAAGNRLMFPWCESGFGCQLFGTDGTAGGTVGVSAIATNRGIPMAASNGLLYFPKCSSSTGSCVLRQTDGTLAGTVDATTLFPRTDLTISGLNAFNADRVLLTAGVAGSGLQLWTIQPGSAAAIVGGPFAYPPGKLAEVDGRALFYTTTDPSSAFARDLWVTDGTAIGTRLVARTAVNSLQGNDFVLRPLVAGKSVAYQQCVNLSYCEIWRTNSSGATPSPIARVHNGSSSITSTRENSSPYLAFGNRLVFLGDDGKEGYELWAVNVPQPIEGDADEDGIPDAIDNTANGTNPGVKDNNIFANAHLFAMQQARDFLGREATASEITTMVNAIASGTTRSALIEQMLNTPEHFDLYGPILRLYQAYFLRPSDIGGLNFWVTQYKNRPASGWSFEGISEFFSLSPEFQQRYGALNNNQFVTLIYNNVLKRAPDTGGLAFWVDELDKGRRIRGNVMAGFSESPENKGKTKGEVQVATLYAVMLKKDIDPAVYAEWVPRINAGQSIRPLIDQLFAKPEYRARFLP